MALFNYAGAQVSFSAKSGDSELDLTLNDMNIQAKADINLFNTNMKASYNITEQKLNYLSVTVGMQPADIYLTLEIGKITGRSIDDVVNAYQKHKGKGWGVIAKEMGIKPGSKEFHLLKGNTKEKNSKMKKNKNNQPEKGNTVNKGKPNNANGKKK
jgi:ribosomal protein L12E/L44/L45/RPP1/RPP2